MKYIAFIALCAGMIAFSGTRTYAQEVSDQSPETTIISQVTNFDQDLVNELTELKQKEESSSGIFTKFLLRLKIRQLENQLNIKKALE